jgi:hypothetical protein
VDGDVKDDPTTWDLGESPATQLLWEEDGVVDPRRAQHADPALCDEAAGSGMERATGEVVVHGQDDAVAVGGVDHGLGVCNAQGHGFLNQDVLAGFRGGHRFGHVLIIAGGDVHGVDVAGEELVKVSGVILDPTVGPIRKPAGLVVVQAAYADAESGEGRQHPSHGDVAGPDEADGERPGRDIPSGVGATLDGVGHFTDPAVRPPMK